MPRFTQRITERRSDGVLVHYDIEAISDDADRVAKAHRESVENVEVVLPDGSFETEKAHKVDD
jgi:hypothetical protein